MAHLKAFEANFEMVGSPYYFGGVLEGLGGVLRSPYYRATGSAL